MLGQDVTVDSALRKQVVESMVDLLVRMLRLDQPVTEETRADELELGSAQAMELLLELEGELSIMIDVDELDLEDVHTLGDLADYVASHATAT